MASSVMRYSCCVLVSMWSALILFSMKHSECVLLVLPFFAAFLGKVD